MKHAFVLFACAVALAVPAHALTIVDQEAEAAVSPYWQDRAIIQRDRPIVVEGFAKPGSTVAGKLGDETASATAGADGAFALRFAARAGDATPLTLALNGREVAKDLVVGDVWLCSGQSNMELRVDRALDSASQVGSSEDPLLRFLTIPQAIAGAPQTRFPGHVTWTAASPQTTGAFSAACYSMAKELRRATGVPIGAVHSSWGGSKIRTWLSPEAGRALYGAQEMDLLALYSRDPLKATTAFARTWEGWYRKGASGSEPWKQPQDLAWSPVPAISVWNTWSGTPLASNPVATVWLRRTLTLTPAQAKAGGELSLGVLDELDTTWINGRIVGNTFGWGTTRTYNIPARYLRPGENEIMVAVTNEWDKGGFTSPANELRYTPMSGEPPIPLADGWRFSVAPVTGPPRSPWDSNGGIGVMHNFMIAPLGHVALKGFAWYQGESDVGAPGYRDRLRELVAGWRRQFGSDTRLLVVQLAGYGSPQTAPTESGWAALREEQRQAVLADQNAALVTAIDLGERTDIHPANKIELGRRLALAAQGKPLPHPLGATREPGAVRVRFSGVTGALSSWSAPHATAFELCGPDRGSCRFADARVDGDSVLIKDDGRAATRVRYAWADAPIVNTFDAASAPLPGFEVAIAAPR